jgi:hypothetical protein
MIRNLAAAVAGVIVAMVAIQLVQMLGHLVYPPPADIEFGEPEQVREFMATLPVGSILFVGAAWFVGTFVGTVAGALVARSGAVPYAIVVGGFVLAGAILMLVVIPHPWWFTIAAPLSIIAAAILAGLLAPGLRPSPGSIE